MAPAGVLSSPRSDLGERIRMFHRGVHLAKISIKYSLRKDVQGDDGKCK